MISVLTALESTSIDSDSCGRFEWYLKRIWRGVWFLAFWSLWINNSMAVGFHIISLSGLAFNDFCLESSISFVKNIFSADDTRTCSSAYGNCAWITFTSLSHELSSTETQRLGPMDGILQSFENRNPPILWKRLHCFPKSWILFLKIFAEFVKFFYIKQSWGGYITASRYEIDGAFSLLVNVVNFERFRTWKQNG